MRALKIVQSYISDGAVVDSPPKKQDAEPLRYCAYNATRESFLSVDVEVVDSAGLYDHLARFEPGSSMALWVTPFRRISPERVDSPVDLVFLDRNYCVLETVESFPLSLPSASRPPADSVLALPAQTIADTGTTAGDQLVLCAPDKIRRRLHIQKMSKATGKSQKLRPIADSAEQQSDRKSFAQTIRWEIYAPQSQPAPLAICEAPPEVTAPNKATGPARVPAPAEMPKPSLKMTESGRDVAKVTKNWLQRWLAIEPEDDRRTPREVLPTLVAYFFNGGAPTPCTIRNASLSGMYMCTTERWYLGTIIRITLTDQRRPISERSITVNGIVVRWGDDGVGFHFIFHKEKKGRRKSPYPAADEPLVSVTQNQFKEFVKLLKEECEQSH